MGIKPLLPASLFIILYDNENKKQQQSTYNRLLKKYFDEKLYSITGRL